jgi:hypothetical protein
MGVGTASPHFPIIVIDSDLAYAAAGIGILLACGVYYVLWIYAIPKWRGYQVRHEKVVLDGGEVTHKLVKVPLDKLEEWDRVHDAQGGKPGQRDGSSDGDVVDVDHGFVDEEKRGL